MDERTSVQRAYDEVVGSFGYPTERAQSLLKSHDGLIRELYDAATWLTASHDDLDPTDVFLAAFTAGLIWTEDRTT